MEPVVPLDRVNLDEVSGDYRPVIVREPKFTLSLMNGFCSEEKVVTLTKSQVAANITYYRNRLPGLIAKFEALVAQLKPDFFLKATDFYPLDIHLSVDGDGTCYNATAEANHIELPAQKSPMYLKGTFELLFHEIGHALTAFNGADQNIFDETVADAVSRLLHDANGLFPVGAKQERQLILRQLFLGNRDPHALASELAIEYTEVPAWLKENGLKYKCQSDEYYRDFRSDLPVADALEGGGESYIVSCAVHSLLQKLGRIQGERAVLLTFVQTYLARPALFNEINLPRIFQSVFPGTDFLLLDPSVRRLSLRPSEAPLTVSWSSFTDDEGQHYRLHWNHPRLPLDWGMVGFRDGDRNALASFSLIQGNNSAVLSSRTEGQCLEEGLVCLCPRGKNVMSVEFAWMAPDGARSQEKLVQLPIDTKGCFELGLPENLKRK